MPRTQSGKEAFRDWAIETARYRAVTALLCDKVEKRLFAIGRLKLSCELHGSRL